LIGSPVVYLEFKLFTSAQGYTYAEVKKLLEYKHLEQDQRINPLAHCISVALLRATPFKKWTD